VNPERAVWRAPLEIRVGESENDLVTRITSGPIRLEIPDGEELSELDSRSPGPVTCGIAGSMGSALPADLSGALDLSRLQASMQPTAAISQT
jgi:hypothetical protein